MRVKCISQKLDEDQNYKLYRNSKAKEYSHITLGKEYPVFGLSFLFDSEGNGCFVQILSDYDHLLSIPIALFEIIDKRMSVFWEFKRFNDDCLTLWPSSFYRDYYHDDLFEGVPDIVADFYNVKLKILNEFPPIQA
jgi:hypothetical protein